MKVNWVCLFLGALWILSGCKTAVQKQEDVPSQIVAKTPKLTVEEKLKLKEQEFKSCAQPHQKGSVKILFEVNQTGKVLHPVVARSTLKDSKVEACIINKLKKINFGKQESDSVTLTYPFIF